MAPATAARTDAPPRIGPRRAAAESGDGVVNAEVNAIRVRVRVRVRVTDEVNAIRVRVRVRVKVKPIRVRVNVVNPNSK